MNLLLLFEASLLLLALIVSSHLKEKAYAHRVCRCYLCASFFIFLLQATALFLFKLAAYVTETAIFLALGLSVD